MTRCDLGHLSADGLGHERLACPQPSLRRARQNNIAQTKRCETHQRMPWRLTIEPKWLPHMITQHTQTTCASKSRAGNEADDMHGSNVCNCGGDMLAKLSGGCLTHLGRNRVVPLVPLCESDAPWACNPGAPAVKRGTPHARRATQTLTR